MALLFETQTQWYRAQLLSLMQVKNRADFRAREINSLRDGAIGWRAPETMGGQPLRNDLPVGVLVDDVAVPKHVEIAAAHLDPVAAWRRSGQKPLRHAGAAVDEMLEIPVMNVGGGFEAGQQTAPTLSSPT